MQVTEVSKEHLSREYTVKIAADDIQQKIDFRLEQLSGQVRLPGFRPGKVPLKLMKQRYGQAVMGEVLEQAVQDSSSQMMNEKGLRPAMQPKIEITSFEEGGDLEYKIAVEVLPEIEPMDFKALKLERLNAAVPEARIEEALERIATEQGTAEPISAERAAKSGDIAVIDFIGRIDGEAFEGGAAEDFQLELGSGRFIPGFEEQIIGKQPDGSFDVNVSFPDDYPAETLKGKPAVFEVTLKEIREKKPAALDDDFAQTMGLDDMAALREAVKQQIEKEHASLTRTRLKRDLLDALAETHDFEVPPGMKQMEFDTIWKRLDEERAAGTLDEEDQAKSEDELRAEYDGIAERRVRLGLLLAEVGRRNNVQVSGEDLNRAILDEARRFPGQERQIFEFYQQNQQALDSLRAPIFEEKVVDFIVELADVTDREAEVDEILAEPDAEPKKPKAKAKPRKAKAKSQDAPEAE